MRYVIYVMIGIGITIGMEAREGKELPNSFKIINTLTWPITVSGAAFIHLLPKKETRDEN